MKTLYFMHKAIVFDKNASKLAGYTSSLKYIRCEIVRREGDEVFIKVKKTKWFPAGIIRVMKHDLIEK